MTDEKYLPEWEVGIVVYGPDDPPDETRSDHFHPRAETKEEAREKAVKKAKKPGIGAIIGKRDAYEVVDVHGPDYSVVPERSEHELRAERCPDDQATLDEVAA